MSSRDISKIPVTKFQEWLGDDFEVESVTVSWNRFVHELRHAAQNAGTTFESADTYCLVTLGDTVCRFHMRPRMEITYYQNLQKTEGTNLVYSPWLTNYEGQGMPEVIVKTAEALAEDVIIELPEPIVELPLPDWFYMDDPDAGLYTQPMFVSEARVYWRQFASKVEKMLA